RQGYQVLDAASPLDALALARDADQPIDLLLTDIVMPQMRGTELAKELSAIRPGLKVMYMSGYTDTALVLTADRPFIQKPFTAAALYAKVEKALKS
ncbi:MAG TPA: response regulator, partial [Bryobacteraceae bacterium]